MAGGDDCFHRPHDLNEIFVQGAGGGVKGLTFNGKALTGLREKSSGI
jgi:hypothetical protein